MLGFKSFDENINNLSKEIELIKSSLFFSKVVEELQFDVSYYQYGDILFEERYTNSPFIVRYSDLKSHVYNLPIDLEILSPTTFTLTITMGGQVITSEHRFNDTIRTA